MLFYLPFVFSMILFIVNCNHAATGVRHWWENVGLAPHQGVVTFSKLMHVIPIASRTLVAINVGGQDGIFHDPTYELYRDLNFTGLVFEGDPEYLPILRTNMQKVNHTNNVHVIEEFVSSLSLPKILDQYKIPKDFDVLKIDIDSFDYAILKAVLNAQFIPKLIMMEINPDVPPPFQWFLDEKDFSFDVNRVRKGLYGVSADALFNLLHANGYNLVETEFLDPTSECDRCEHNMWFIAKEFVNEYEITPMSWVDMVHMFWQRQPACLHMQRCPLKGIHHMCDGRQEHGVQASLNLANPMNYPTAVYEMSHIMEYMKGICPTCTMHGAITTFDLIDSAHFKGKQCINHASK
jgi:hypothetical protein